MYPCVNKNVIKNDEYYLFPEFEGLVTESGGLIDFLIGLNGTIGADFDGDGAVDTDGDGAKLTLDFKGTIAGFSGL
jgi:hypothetical protein